MSGNQSRDKSCYCPWTMNWTCLEQNKKYSMSLLYFTLLMIRLCTNGHHILYCYYYMMYKPLRLGSFCYIDLLHKCMFLLMIVVIANHYNKNIEFNCMLCFHHQIRYQNSLLLSVSSWRLCLYMIDLGKCIG